MLRYPSVFLRLIATSILALCLFIPIVGLSDDEPNEQQQEALKDVRKKIDRLRKQINKTQTKHDAVRTELRQIEGEISSLHKVLNRLGKKLKKQKRKLNKLHRDRKTLRRDLSTQRRYLAQQIKAAYMIGEQEYLKLLLNQEEPSEISRTMAYYDYFNRARLSRIETSQTTLDSLIKLEKQINNETAVLKQTKTQQLAKKKKLEQASASRAMVVARLGNELVSKEQNLANLLQDEKRLQNLISELDEVIPDILTEAGKRTPFARSKGKLRWPTKGKLQALFGKRRAQSKVSWNGVMILAKEGHNVRAVSHGRVAFADWLRGYGLLLIIDHGNGYMSLYGHNQTIYKETGEWVEAGEVIAGVGRSGGQKETGLYFEIRHNGKPTNPVKWCRTG